MKLVKCSCEFCRLCIPMTMRYVRLCRRLCFPQATNQNTGIVALVWLTIVPIIRSSHVVQTEAPCFSMRVATLDALGLAVSDKT